MAEPVSLAEAKAHLRVTSGSEDDVIQGCLDAAHQHVESITGLVLEARQVVERLDHQSNGRLRAFPVQSVVSAAYGDAADQGQYLATSDYELVNHRRPAQLILLGFSWPFARPVEVTVEAGYPSPAAVPAALRQAILMAAGHFYRDREGAEAMPATVAALCEPYQTVMG